MQNYKGVFLKLNVVSDKSVISKLEQIKNKQGYIKELISKDSLIYKNYRKEGTDEQCYHDNT